MEHNAPKGDIYLDTCVDASSNHAGRGDLVDLPRCARCQMHRAGNRIVSFASCRLFVAAAVLDHRAQLHVTRVARKGQASIDESRIRQWVTRTIAIEQPGLVVLAVGGAHDDTIREAVDAVGRATLPFERTAIASILGTRASTVASLRSAVIARAGPLLQSAPQIRRESSGARRQLERYWAMAIVALAAALAADLITDDPLGLTPPDEVCV